MDAISKTTPSRSKLRDFAWTMGGAFTVLGAIAALRHGHATPILFFGLAGLFLLSGLIAPEALSVIHTLWMKFAGVLAWINARIILSLFYYAFLTPLGIAARLLRRDALRRKFDRSPSTYWHTRGPMRPAKKSYEHLY